jgi:hypothetical protein
MNCAECRDNLVACLEGLLEPELAGQCRAHLETCAACRAEHASFSQLQARLVAAGRLAAEVSLTQGVMQRVQRVQTKSEGMTIMSKLLKHRWGFGLGALAGTAAIVLFIALALPGNVQAKAADVLARGAQAVAKLTSIHLRGQLRTLPADNFSYINPDRDFYTIELWKQFEPELKWRVDKPGRLAVMDGQSTLLYINSAKHAAKHPGPSRSAFDTDWLHRIANLSNTISNELRNAQARGWKLDLTEETGADGRAKSVVTVFVKSGVPDNDYCKNTFLDNADTRRVYKFDSQTERLDSVQIFLARASGEVQIFDLNQIEYNQPLDPKLWQVELPADVSWYEQPQKLPDNEKYASMTAGEAARAFFEACGRQDWAEAAKFYSPMDARIKEYLGGLQIVSLGQEFTSKSYPGRFIPYEIKLPGMEFNLRLSNSNSAGRYVITGVFDRNLKQMEELKWAKTPETLPDNDTYARLSPAEAAKAYFAAQAKQDWTEMKKFVPEYDVENDRRKLAEAMKSGLDAQHAMPVFESGEAVWSPEQSAYFVKCRQLGTKKWNLAIRKDNPAGRWQVDGGL